MTLRLAIALILVSVPSAAVPRNYEPKTIFSVLVDLSATWHNAAAHGYNAHLLRALGSAVAGAAANYPKPFAVRYHVIGTDSLARTPICSIAFQPSLFAIGSSEGVERDAKVFQAYLTSGCPSFILRQPKEPMTEIAAAVISAREADAMSAPNTRRVMIICSDFKEESRTRYDLRRVDLRDTKVIMLWRTLSEDRRDPRALQARVSRWQGLLRSRGAPSVLAFSDTAVVNSPAAFKSLIGRQ